MRTSAWWRSNRLWVLLAIPSLALALAASSFRLSAVYLRWQWSQPTLLRAPGTYSQTFTAGTRTLQRTVQVGVAGVNRTDQVDGEYPAPGTVLWQIRLDFAASADQILAACEIELQDASGKRYSVEGVKVDARGRPNPPWIRRGCTPADAPGPTLDLDGGIVPSPIPRSQSWQVVTSVALPPDVQPTLVRVMWDRPAYLTLAIPQ